MAQCLADDIFPVRRVHLLGGVSDAGKTRFILPLLMQWQAGLPILGRASHPVPWVYVVGDRLVEEAHDTLSDMHIPPASVRIIPAFGQHNKSYTQILLAASVLQPQPQFLVIEGFGDLCGESRSEVREFLGSIGSYCQGCTEFPAGLTILGIVESPKQKPYERYANPRQRISGSSAWGYHSSTVILVESEDQECNGPDRTVWLCMKNSQRRKLKASFDSLNRLVVP